MKVDQAAKMLNRKLKDAASVRSMKKPERPNPGRLEGGQETAPSAHFIQDMKCPSSAPLHLIALDFCYARHLKSMYESTNGKEGHQ